MSKRDLIVAAALARVPASIDGKPICGYIMGATGWICTQARINAQAKQYPAYAVSIRKYGPRWMFMKCYDCAQLTRVCAKAAGYSLVSGSNSQWKQNIWEEKGTIATLPADCRGLILYRLDPSSGKMSHTSVAVGDTEVEAMGHAYGVVQRVIAKRTFTHWAKLIGLDENGGEVIVTDPTPNPTTTRDTLTKGMKGVAVAEMQMLLMAHGISLPWYGPDGDFGKETLVAVKQFQGLNGLTVDGVVGPATWNALEIAAEVDPPQEYTVTIPDQSEIEANALLAKYPGATKTIE